MPNNEDVMKYAKKWTPLMKKLGRRFSNTIVSEEDLFNEGVLAIYEALERYNPKLGHINTFLYRCIKNRILGVAFKNNFPVSVPSGSYAIIKDKQKQYKKFDFGNMNGLRDKYNKGKQRMFEWNDTIQKYDKDSIAQMYFFGGLKYREIKEITGKNLATISRHINNVREIIKHKIRTE